MKAIQKTILSLPAMLFLVLTAQAQVVSMEWTRHIGGAYEEYGWKVATDVSGNVFLAGFFNGTTDFDPGPGTVNLTAVGKFDVFLAKFDAAGGFLWARHIGGPEEDRANSIAVDADGNLLVTGFFGATVDFDPGPGILNFTSDYPKRIFWLKLSGTGDLVWARCTESINSNSEGQAIAVDGSGSVITLGNFNGSADFDPGTGTAMLSAPNASNCFVQKLNAAGDFVWVRQLVGEGAGDAKAMALDESGNVISTGYFTLTTDFDPGPGTFNLTSVGSGDMFFSKLNAAGEFVWARAVGGPNVDYAAAVTVDVSGNIFATGPFQGTYDFDPGSGVFNMTSAGTRNIFILKLDAGGNLGWAKMFSGTGIDYAYSIVTDRQGRIFLTGGFKGTTDFDPGAGTASLTTAGIEDWFLAKLDANGNLVRVSRVGGISYEIGNDLAIDGSGTIYTVGYFGGTADFDPGTGTLNLTNQGGADCFISKWSQDLSGIDVTGNDRTLHIFPNPTNGMLYIRSETILNKADIRVLDLQGRRITELVNQHGDAFSLDLTGTADGIYLIEIEDTSGIIRKKVIRQR